VQLHLEAPASFVLRLSDGPVLALAKLIRPHNGRSLGAIFGERVQHEIPITIHEDLEALGVANTESILEDKTAAIPRHLVSLLPPAQRADNVELAA